MVISFLTPQKDTVYVRTEDIRAIYSYGDGWGCRTTDALYGVAEDEVKPLIEAWEKAEAQ